ncbi:hypothetical protein NIES2104_23800 [Leptolyngbya sp. NIES-2104]|nr:hypothetical protein NIES2104_23800 [Leptolyngbya sp. NIES-2104]
MNSRLRTSDSYIEFLGATPDRHSIHFPASPTVKPAPETATVRTLHRRERYV